MGGGISMSRSSISAGEDSKGGKKRKSMKKMDSVFVNKAHLKHTHEMQDAHLYDEHMVEDMHHPMINTEANASVKPPHGEAPLAPSPDSGMYSPGSTRRGSLGSSYEPNQDAAAERLAAEASNAAEASTSRIATAPTSKDEEGAAPVEAAESAP
jgi:hypothetical protein